MQVAQYTFQSPYPSPVQVGRLDPSSVKEDNAQNTNQSFNPTTQTELKAQSFEATQKQDVKPTVKSNRLDIYA